MKKIIFLTFSMLVSLVFSALKAENTSPNSANDNPANATLTCALPAPASMAVTNVTETTISFTWAPVPTAVAYNITAFDMDNGVALPTNTYVVSGAQVPAYTLTNLPMQTNIRIGVSATSCIGGAFGDEIALVQQTDGIIVIDVVITSPCPPGSGSHIGFNSGDPVCTISTVPVSQDPPTYVEASLKVFKAADANRPGSDWSGAVNLVARVCPNGSTKLICNETGLYHVLPGSLNQTQGTLTFYKEAEPNVVAFKIYNIQKQATSITFKVGTQDNSNPQGNPVQGKYDGHCDVTGLSGNPCYQGTYAQVGGNGIGGSGGGKERSNMDEEGISIEILPATESIKAIPNPFNDFTNVQYQVSKQSPVSIVLFNAVGQAQRELLNDREVEPGTYTLPVDMTDLAPGVYYLTIQTESGRKITTVVKQ